ncbi:MAG: sigma 54-interacting transcriptional regulator [Candidatus Latescibacteria bacterium]|jgi:transcriptional regulator with GAF, ATPase, and Fis domain|nr:sigma 54-interacting transcriptional regulator [Candidatus Latescibacterota bacterium]
MNREEFLLGAIRVFSSSFDIAEAAGHLIKYVNQIMPTDVVILTVSEPTLKAQRYLAFATLEKAEWFDKLIPLSNDQISEIIDKDMTKARIIEYTTNTGDPDIIRREGLALGDRTALALPLIADKNYMGFINFTSVGKGKYTQEHIDLISPLQKSFAMVLANALKYREIVKLKEILADDNRYLLDELHILSGDTIIGRDTGLKQVMEMVNQVAPLESPVLLEGETGTGKEVIANAIHYSSPRKNGPFIKVNCGAIPESLVDSELFGHEKGAFTDAAKQKRGRFERASGGTLFLDEIGELTFQAQVKLLRAIQQKEIERVGGTSTIPLDIRVITATHRDLESMVQQNRFREDLLFRLNVFPIEIPPLRHRKEDIPLLVDHFIEKKAREMKLGLSMRLAPGAIDRLLAYEWRGNVRELENVVEREIIRNREGFLRFEELVPSPQPQSMPGILEGVPFVSLEELNRAYILRALQLTNHKVGSTGGAAELLQVNVSTLRAKMKKLGIPLKKDRVGKQ